MSYTGRYNTSNPSDEDALIFGKTPASGAQPLNATANNDLQVAETGVSTSLGIAGAAFTSADQSASAAPIITAPTAGLKAVITDIYISVGATAQTITLTEETTNTVLFKLYVPVNGYVAIRPKGKLKLATAVKRLQLQSSAAGNVSATVLYYTEA